MKSKEEMIQGLVSIENDIVKLSVILKGQPLQRREIIMTLLQDIELTAVTCRKRLGATGFTNAIVTQKEVRELLEAFA